jgi:hypothetical protein
VAYWQLESCLKSLAIPSDPSTAKDYKKTDNNRTGGIAFKPYDNFFDKKEAPTASYPIDDPSKITPALKPATLEQSDSKSKPFKYSSSIDHYDTKKSLEHLTGKPEPLPLPDPDGLEKLIQSFRKLCNNFEANHKKLLREDQNFKENFKE